MKIIIISRYLGENNAKNHLFHFKGYYAGQKVENIELISDLNFERSEDYKLEVQLIELKNKTLIAKVLNSSKIWA